VSVTDAARQRRPSRRVGRGLPAGRRRPARRNSPERASVVHARRRVGTRPPPCPWKTPRLPCRAGGRGRTCCATPSRGTCWPVRAVAAACASSPPARTPVVIRKIFTHLGLPTALQPPRPSPADLCCWSLVPPASVELSHADARDASAPPASGASPRPVGYPTTGAGAPAGTAPGTRRADHALRRYGKGGGLVDAPGGWLPNTRTVRPICLRADVANNP